MQEVYTEKVGGVPAGGCHSCYYAEYVCGRGVCFGGGICKGGTQKRKVYACVCVWGGGGGSVNRREGVRGKGRRWF